MWLRRMIRQMREILRGQGNKMIFAVDMMTWGEKVEVQAQLNTRVRVTDEYGLKRSKEKRTVMVLGEIRTLRKLFSRFNPEKIYINK